MPNQINHKRPLLSAMREFGSGSLVPWFVAITLIAQALIPLQSHTRLAVDERGMVIQICTLDAIVEKTVSIEDSISTLLDRNKDSDTDTDPTPAMLFSQLMAEALLTLDAVQPSWLTLQVSELPPAVLGTVIRRPQRLTSIRAPPSLV